MGQTSSCPTTTRCPTCPTCSACPVCPACPAPVPAVCPSLKLLYIENVTDNGYTAYWSSNKSNYNSYKYNVVLSPYQNFPPSSTYTVTIQTPTQEDPLLSANYNSKNFVSNIDNFNTPPVFYAKMQMLDSSLNLVEESSVVEITKIRFDSLTFQTQNDPTKVGQFKFNIVFSLSKIFRDMSSQNPMNIEFSVNTSSGITTYSYPLDTTIPGDTSQVRPVVSIIANLGSANVIPVYARLFKTGTANGKVYYSNYLKPISI